MPRAAQFFGPSISSCCSNHCGRGAWRYLHDSICSDTFVAQGTELESHSRGRRFDPDRLHRFTLQRRAKARPGRSAKSRCMTLFRIKSCVWIRENRPALVADALTICQGYFAAGRPEQALPAMGSFEGWSLIRQIVVWAGLPDPLTTQIALAEASDLDGAKFRGLIAGVEEIAPGGEWVTTAEIFRRIDARGSGACLLRDVLLEHCPGKGGTLPDARRLGFELRHFLGRIVDGKAIQTDPGRVAKWRVADGGRSGFVGSSTPIPRATPPDKSLNGGETSASSAHSAGSRSDLPRSHTNSDPVGHEK